MGGVKAELDKLIDRHSLPMEAFEGSYKPFDVSNYWLRRAVESDQIAAMTAWFEDRYFVPSSEDLKQKAYAEGGPLSAAPVLSQRFGRYASPNALEFAIEELHLRGGKRWAPVQVSSQDTYDDDFSIQVAEFSAPAKKILERVNEIKALQLLEEPFAKNYLVRNLAFGAAITALESFLWETMVYWVENDDDVVRRIVTTHPAFKDQLIKLGTIFEKRESLRTDILGFMQGVVWHNWDKVSTLYKYGLGLGKLNLDKFTPAVLTRHDIIHRSGLTKTGEKVEVTFEQISELCREISAFATSVSTRIEEEHVYLPF